MDVDKLNINKLKTVLIDWSKPSNTVNNDFVENALHLGGENTEKNKKSSNIAFKLIYW